MDSKTRNRIMLATGRDPVALEREQKMNDFYRDNPLTYSENATPAVDKPFVTADAKQRPKECWDPTFDNSAGSPDRKAWMDYHYPGEPDPLLRKLPPNPICYNMGRKATFLPDGTVTLEGRCFVTKMGVKVEGCKTSKEQWQKLCSGKGLLQDVVPDWSADAREFWISGTSPEGWGILFPKE